MAGQDDGACLGAGEVVQETDKALLIRLESGDEKWIPKSVIHDDSEVYDVGENSSGEVVVQQWLAKKEGLG